MSVNNNDTIRHIKTADIKTSTQNKSFLYIGHALLKTKKCMSLFDQSFISRNLSSAREFMLESLIEKGHIPTLIIIDVPYNNSELTTFINWMKHYYPVNVPVIYNESAIPTGQIKQLHSLKLVDDIVKIENYCNRLHQKAHFLKKVKAYMREPLGYDQIDVLYKNAEASEKGISVFKRLFDIVVSFTAILFFLPLMILIAIIIKLESKGPAIYSSYRAGRGFKTFKFFKFRTMVADADKKIDELADQNLYEDNETPAFFKIKNDPRVTRFGAFLRNTSLDELPQLFNVLIGDMSIVGNRPLPLYEAAVLTTDEWAERFMAPAGITGLWQVTKRGSEEMSAEERLALDIKYARNNNFRTDFWIMLQTPSALIQKANV
jgi:lipopolysaccharide/colanic/teichoic acid biosynthesis glycosyltransferase